LGKERSFEDGVSEPKYGSTWIEGKRMEKHIIMSVSPMFHIF
jgi:hypothetical protein